PFRRPAAGQERPRRHRADGDAAQIRGGSPARRRGRTGMSGIPPIKVLIIDNHPLVLAGLRAVLETYGDIEIVGTAGLARDGLEIALATRPAVVLMDINMPQLNGIDAIELFREQLPETRILMLSMHDSREYISTSIMHGASGYILKD